MPQALKHDAACSIARTPVKEIFVNVELGSTAVCLIFGTCADASLATILGSKAVATFGLLLTIFGCLQSAANAISYAVGLCITAAYWFTASTSFANPDVTVVRAVR